MLRECPRWRVSTALLVGAFALALGACGRDEPEVESPAAEAPAPATRPAEPAAPPAAEGGGEIAAEARAEARQIFETRCFTCHGMRGEGDGPGSAGLSPQPRNLTEPEWQASVTDEHIEQIILYGGAAVGLSPAMPPNPDLTSRPAVVAALVEHVRGLSSEDATATPEGGAR